MLEMEFLEKVYELDWKQFSCEITVQNLWLMWYNGGFVFMSSNFLYSIVICLQKM